MPKGRFHKRKVHLRKKQQPIILLQHLSNQLSSAITPEEIAHLAVSSGMEVVGGRMAMFSVVTPDGTGLHLLSSSGVPSQLLPYIQNVPIHLPGPLTDAIRTRQPLWIQTLDEYRARYPRLVEMSHSQTTTHAVACLPLVVNNRTIGGMTFSFIQPQVFSDHTRNLMMTLVNQCAQALERANLFRAEHHARMVAEALSTTATILNSSLDLSEVLDHILLNIRRVMPHDAADVVLLEGENVRVVRTQGYEQYGLAEVVEQMVVVISRRPLLQQMIETRQPVLIAEVLDHSPEPFHAYVGVPICHKAEVIGFLNLHSTQRGFFSQHQANWLKVFAEQAATAIQNARLYEQAQEYAAIQERQRLARDLHDSVSQMLFTSSMIAEALPRLSKLNPDKLDHYLEQLHRLNRGAHAEMRNLILELNHKHLERMTLCDLLKQLTQAASGRSPLTFDLSIDDGVELPVDVLLVYYRVTQESLNNISKHAKATRVEISLKSKPYGIELKISDNGVGFEQSKTRVSSLGLKFMKERAEKIGANVEIQSVVDRGTTVSLAWSPKRVDRQAHV
jgi:signal transduction histidine kinase